MAGIKCHVIDGLVGSGKSTLIRRLSLSDYRNRYVFVQEPVHNWLESPLLLREQLAGNFRHYDIFQCVALNDLFAALVRGLRSCIESNKSHLIIERHPFTTVKIFSCLKPVSKTHFEENSELLSIYKDNLCQTYKRLLVDNLFTGLLHNNDWIHSYTIINTSKSTALKRIVERGRECEVGTIINGSYPMNNVIQNQLDKIPNHIFPIVANYTSSDTDINWCYNTLL